MHRKTRENSINLVLDGIKSFQNPQDLQRAIQIASINLAKHYEENNQNDLNEKLLLIANFIMPNDSSVLTSLANFYHNKCEFKKSYSMALAATRSLNNQSIDAILNAAITATDAGLRDDAFKFFKMTLRKDKNCHRAKFGLATEYFRQNKLKEAWSLYSSRHEAFETDRYLPEKIKSLPRWDGKSDGNLLLYNEQGYGDFIFGLRYLQFIDKNKNPVKIHADKNFKPFIDSTVDSYNYFPNKFTPQYRSSILDLPYLLKKFGFYQDAYKKLFNQRDIVSNKKCRVGIAYSGSTGYHGDRTRSILLSKFKQIDIMVSVEGIGGHNDYVRYGSKWETIDANIQRLNTLLNIEYFNIGYILQHYSYYTLIPVLQYCVNHAHIIRVQTVTWHDYLEINTLMPAQVTDLLEQIEKFIVDNPVLTTVVRGQDTPLYITHLNSAIEYIKTVLTSQYAFNENNRSKFFEFTRSVDSIRKITFDQAFLNK